MLFKHFDIGNYQQYLLFIYQFYYACYLGSLLKLLLHIMAKFPEILRRKCVCFFTRARAEFTVVSSIVTFHEAVASYFSYFGKALQLLPSGEKLTAKQIEMTLLERLLEINNAIKTVSNMTVTNNYQILVC